MARGVDITWQGGEHTFALPIELLRALQDRCDAGPAWVLARLGSQQWRVEDVVDTIRLGLEGGGLAKDEARKLTRIHVEDRPLTLSVLTAQAILMDALFGGAEEGAGAGEPKAAVTP